MTKIKRKRNKSTILAASAYCKFAYHVSVQKMAGSDIGVIILLVSFNSFWHAIRS